MLTIDCQSLLWYVRCKQHFFTWFASNMYRYRDLESQDGCCTYLVIIACRACCLCWLLLGLTKAFRVADGLTMIPFVPNTIRRWRAWIDQLPSQQAIRNWRIGISLRNAVQKQFTRIWHYNPEWTCKYLYEKKKNERLCSISSFGLFGNFSVIFISLIFSRWCWWFRRVFLIFEICYIISVWVFFVTCICFGSELNRMFILYGSRTTLTFDLILHWAPLNFHLYVFFVEM